VRAHVLELPSVDVPVQRVVVTCERRQHEVGPPVAIIIAGVHAHPGLRARFGVHGHSRRQPHALERAAEVVIEELGLESFATKTSTRPSRS
jgi:hypothetical protein